ncbi:MAG: RNA 2',3'-cyclic phosphodiesterase [Clostridiales bacterium]|nr:RNA 2',3'-cyclic phosphodiesterase [Clostridiales bacterium]
MRLFIALALPNDILKAAYKVSQDLVARGLRGVWVPFGNHHITLRFLGETDELLPLVRAMRQSVRDAKPMTCKLDGYASFAKGALHTGYLSLSGDLAEMERLYANLDSALSAAGFHRGNDRFTPHITLGRRLPEADAVAVPPLPMVLRELVLFESTRVKDRMIYTAVHKERF